MYDIFISYAREDKEKADLLAKRLKQKGMSVWLDDRIPPGRFFDDAIDEALKLSQKVVVLWSKKSILSAWVKTEASEAFKRRILIPALLEEVEVPIAFRRIQTAQLVGWKGELQHKELDEFLELITQKFDEPDESPNGESKKSLFDIGFIARTAVSEFKFALESEFDCLELSTNPGTLGYFINSVNELVRWRKYFDIPIAAIGYFGVEYHLDKEEYSNLKSLMNACKVLGIKIIHIGSGSPTNKPSQDLTRTIDLLRTAIKDAMERDLTLALYTCKVSNFAWDPCYWDEIFKKLPDLKLKYDPSHAFHTDGRDCFAEIREWGKKEKIVHFHAKGGYLDSDGKRNPLGDPPPGKDQIDWVEVMKALFDVKYNGAICIELHSDRYFNGEYKEVLKSSKKYLLESMANDKA